MMITKQKQSKNDAWFVWIDVSGVKFRLFIHAYKISTIVKTMITTWMRVRTVFCKHRWYELCCTWDEWFVWFLFVCLCVYICLNMAVLMQKRANHSFIIGEKWRKSSLPLARPLVSCSHCVRQQNIHCDSTCSIHSEWWWVFVFYNSLCYWQTWVK